MTSSGGDYRYGEMPRDFANRPQPSSRRLLVFTLGGILLCLLGCAGAVVMGFTTWVQPAARTENPLPITDRARLAEKHARLAAAFTSGKGAADRREVNDVRRLLDGIVEACSNSDDAAFREHIDFERHWDQVQRSGAMPAVSFFKQRLSRWQLSQFMQLPAYWESYDLARVDVSEQGDTAQAFGYFWDSDGGVNQVQWWLVRGEGRWKAYDWEIVDFGIRDTTEWALLVGYENDPRVDDYFRIFDDVRSASELSANGDYDRAVQRLERAQQRVVLPQLRYTAAVQIAYGWLRLNRHRETLAYCRDVDHPQAAPGVLYAQALAYNALGRHGKAHELAVRLASLTGGDPVIFGIQADALTALGRFDEAADKWRARLDIDPNDTSALQSLGRLLPDDAAGELTARVRACEDPAETAADLAEHFALYDREAAAGEMVAIVRQQAPDSPRLDYVLGVSSEAAGRYAEAARCFARAVERETDEATRGRYMYSLMDALLQEGDALATYQAAPDAQTAFEHISYSYADEEWNIDDEQFQQVLEAHRERRADDPWLDYYQAMLLTNQKRFADAEQILLAALANADEGADDEGLCDSLRYQLMDTLFAAREVMRAYETLPPAEQTFKQLADRCRWAERWDDLAALVEAHRAAHPGDPWLDYYHAFEQAGQRKMQHAFEVLKRGYKNAPDEWIRSTYRDSWTQLLDGTGNDTGAYMSFVSREESFTELAERFQSQRKWRHLYRILDTHRRWKGDESKILFWEVEYLWGTQQFEEIVKLLDPWPADKVETLKAGRQDSLRLRLLYAYAALERSEDAMRVARQLYQFDADPAPMIAAWAVAGDVEQTEQYVLESGVDQYVLDSVYETDVVGEVLRGPDFLPLREKHPPSLPYDASGPTVSLLLRERPPLDAHELQARLAGDPDPQVEIIDLPPTPDAQQDRSWVVRAGGDDFCITVSPKTLFAEEDEVDVLKNDALRGAIAEHQAVLTIDTIQTSRVLHYAQMAAAGGLAKKLADDNTLAIYLSGKQRLLTRQDNFYKILHTQLCMQTFNPGEEIWLSRDDDEEEEFDYAHQRDSSRRLRAAVRDFSKGDGSGDFEFQATLTAGAARERLAFRLDRTKRTRWGDILLIGRLRGDSRILPHLKTGEPLAVRLDQVDEWKVIERQ